MDYRFDLLTTLLTIAGVLAVVLGTCAYLILLERKMAAWVQDRVGPNRVGPLGLLQPLADGAKFLLKEDVIPNHVDKLLYVMAPAIAMGTALFAFAVVPFGPTTAPPVPPVQPAEPATIAAYEQQLAAYNEQYQFVIAPHVDIGIVWVFAVSSLAVYAVILGGWSSNNKYSFLGGLRSSAQLVSYEIPMGLSILGVVLAAGSLNLERIIAHQAAQGWWNALFQPLAFLLFVVSIFAECNRLPFDLPEAEQELVGGYHTEYSALKFAMFFLGEYTHMVTTSFLAAALFLGGWHFVGVGLESHWALKLLVFAGKMALFILLYMHVRWSIPRFRFDQLMGLAWKVLIPLALLNLVCATVVMQYNLSPWLLTLASLALFVGAGALAARPRSSAQAVVR